MKYHILNGDALAEKFPTEKIHGQIIIIRESFIEGPLSKDFSDEFWNKRIEFVTAAYDANKEEYEEQFISQLRMLDTIKNGDEVCLWFEDDLFCLVNMWFAIYYLSNKVSPAFYRIFPKKDNKKWIGFGSAHEKDLIHAFEQKHLVAADDVTLSNHLWEAYVTNDRSKLKALSFSDTTAFRFLPQVVDAHLDRIPEDGSTGRPQQTLIDILNEGKTNFYEIFDDFWKKESIYGFGDMQVYNMLREMEVEFSGEDMEFGI